MATENSFKVNGSISLKDLQKTHYLQQEGKFYVGKYSNQEYNFQPPRLKPEKKNGEYAFLTAVNSSNRDKEVSRDRATISMRTIPTLKPHNRSNSGINLLNIPQNTTQKEAQDQHSAQQNSPLLKRPHNILPSEINIEPLTSQGSNRSYEYRCFFPPTDSWRASPLKISTQTQGYSTEESKTNICINKLKIQNQSSLTPIQRHALPSATLTKFNQNSSGYDTSRVYYENFSTAYEDQAPSNSKLISSIQKKNALYKQKLLINSIPKQYMDSSLAYSTPYSLQEIKIKNKEESKQPESKTERESQQQEEYALNSLVHSKTEAPFSMQKKDPAAQTLKSRVHSSSQDRNRLDLKAYLKLLDKRGEPKLFESEDNQNNEEELSAPLIKEQIPHKLSKTEEEIRIAIRHKKHIQEHMKKVNSIVEKLDGEIKPIKDASEKLKKVTSTISTIKKFNLQGDKNQRQYLKDLQKYNEQLDTNHSIFIKEFYYKLQEFFELTSTKKRASQMIAQIRGFNQFVKSILFEDDEIRTDLTFESLEGQIRSVMNFYKMKKSNNQNRRMGVKKDLSSDIIFELQFFFKNLCEFVDSKHFDNKVAMQSQYKHEFNAINGILQKYILETDPRKQNIKNECFKSVMAAYKDSTPTFVLKNVPLENIKYLEKNYGNFEMVSQFVRDKDKEISNLCRLYTSI